MRASHSEKSQDSQQGGQDTQTGKSSPFEEVIPFKEKKLLHQVLPRKHWSRWDAWESYEWGDQEDA